MLTKQVEQTRKDFPAKIKADNAALITLSKAINALPKAT